MTNLDQPFQDYEILDRVGAGAMGTVFKARHQRLNRIVALKILKPSLARDSRYVKRLRREARIVASLSHPHIVTGYDLGEESGYHFFVMEFVEGKSLRQLLVEWGMFSEDYVLRVARETCEALDHAYQRDVIHRDIKPGNILIDEGGNVKLTDMGLAKGPADLTLTRDGATVGTPMYISPEQARNPQDVDVRSDLYSLGATLYHMATGVPPFAGDTMAELITSVLHDNVVPPDEANSAVSPGMSLVIRKLLAKNLTTRYQTPRELLDDLDLVEKSQLPAVDLGRLDAGAFEASRWPRVVMVTLVASVLVVGAWWIGQSMAAPAVAVPNVEVFMRDLDSELAALPSPGLRYRRLATITDAPPEAARALEQRRRQAAVALQLALDGVIDSLEGSLQGASEAWLKDVSVWPTLAQFSRERLQPLIRERVGLELAGMSPRVSQARVEQYMRSIGELIAQRDSRVRVRFKRFLAEEVPGRANARLRASDFAGADALWRTALPSFFNGLAVPSIELLPEKMRADVEADRGAAYQVALAQLGQAEQQTVSALQQEVETTVAGFRERLEAGADAIAVGEALQRFRSNLGHYWPAADSFRIGSDPWPAIEQQLMSTEQAVELAIHEANGQIFTARCDLAWRVYYYGDPSAALAVLEEIEPVTAAQAKELEGHRRCLRAARLVELALLKAIANHGDLVVFRAGTLSPYSVRVKPSGETTELYGAASDQVEVRLRFTELRIGHLLETLAVDSAGPVRALASVPRALGLTILRLAADDMPGLERSIGALHNADRSLVMDYVWPRIARCRAGRVDLPISRDALFALLAKALDEFPQSQDLRELEGALAAVANIPNEQCTPSQYRLRLRANQYRKLQLRRKNLLADLRAAAPNNAVVDVRVEDGVLASSVTLSASELSRDAGDGWQLRDNWQQHGRVLEFAGSKREWKDQPTVALKGRSGHPARVRQARLEVEMAFPGGDGRYYIIEFDGVSVMLVIAKDNSVQVELIDGGRLDEERARRAFAKALSGGIVPARGFVIVDAPHRLAIDVVSSSSSTAVVKVSFEGRELLSKVHPCVRNRAPDFVVHPFQELHVLRATVTALGQ